MAEGDAERKQELALLEAGKDVALANAEAQNAQALALITHTNETEKSWTLTEQLVASAVTGAWVLSAIGVLVSVIVQPKLAPTMTAFLAILTMMYNIAGPAANRILGNVLNKVNGKAEREE